MGQVGEDAGKEMTFKGPMEREEYEANKRKISNLSEAYIGFKRRNVRHFRFAANSSTFGK